MIRSPWRYPGGKTRLAKRILEHMPQAEGYAEPFVGGGGFTLAALHERVTPGSSVMLGDADPRVAAWWEVLSLKDGGEFHRLVNLIADYKPTVKSFFKVRDSALKSGRLSDRAFAAFATNRTSFSGILSAYPIGGKSQTSKYPVDCRWNPERHVKQHVEVRDLLQKFDVQVLTGDFRQFLLKIPDQSFVYLDPPYVKAGPELYPTHFGLEDHEDLADWLLGRENWLCSYDDSEWVREKFQGFDIADLNTRYTVAVNKRHTSEVLVLSKGLTL